MASVEIRGVDEVKRELATLRLWTRTPVLLIQVSDLSAKKLGWLADDDRDFLSPAGRMAQEMLAAARAGMRVALAKPNRTEDDMLEPWRRMLAAARDRIAKRLRGGGNEIRGQMRPLAPETVKRKGNSIIGYDSGALYRDLVAAPLVVRVPLGGEMPLRGMAAGQGGLLQRLRATAENAPRGGRLRETRAMRRGLRAGLRAAA